MLERHWETLSPCFYTLIQQKIKVLKMVRSAKIDRVTNETDIKLLLNLDGSARYNKNGSNSL